MKIIYIVPAWSDQAGQCRIVSRNVDNCTQAPQYRDNQQGWKEVGLMNSQGKLVCFEGAEAERQEIKDCEPLMAGMYFTFTTEFPATA